MKTTLSCLALLVASAPLLASAMGAQAPAEPPAPATIQEAPLQEVQLQKGLPWNRRTVEHLLNRAGFGARPAAIEAALELGPERVVEHLLEGGRAVEPPFFSAIGAGDFGGTKGLTEAQKREVRSQVRKADREQLARYIGWWIERMVESEDPLRDRMTLFWHGLFTTDSKNVRRTYEVIQQHQLLRNNALESYAVLLHGIVKDPAMLYYLDNTKNKKGKPNENLARELMELFSLGEGNYTERDVQAVARALTGHQAGRDGGFQFNARQHDRGKKTILGQTGKFKAADVVRILLEQDACARWISGRLIEYFEGVWPDEQRHAHYAALLKRSDYELRPFLRELLLDPAFYREEVMGTRVAGPVEYLVGTERRLGLEVSPRFIYSAGKELGQTLFQPPSVKGWEGGESWITTATLIGRGNAAGMMLGVLDVDSALGGAVARADAPMDDGAMMDGSMGDAGMEMGDGDMMGEGMDDSMSSDMDDYAAERGGTRKLPSGLRTLRNALGTKYQPKVNLTWRLSQAGAVTHAARVDVLLDELLAIEAPRETHDELVQYLARECDALELDESELLEHPGLSEPVLRRLAHLVLSLPEAQLH